MERERKKRARAAKLAITEVIMVVAVIGMIILLTFLAMGYNVNKDGEVSQQGIAQIHSMPSGASIAIDGNSILPRTNTNRMMEAGEHYVELTRDNYDSWHKTVNIEPGIVYKLDYPRLFLQNREVETMREYDDNLALFEPAPNHDSILYATKDSTDWNWLDIRGDSAVDQILDMSSILDGLTVDEVEWNTNNDKVLVRSHNADNKTEWILVYVKDLELSINLTREFDMDFSDVKFASGGGERLYVVENNNLRTIITGDKVVSQVIAGNIRDYAFEGETLMYLTADNKVMLYREGEKDLEISQFNAERKVDFALSEYLSKKYISFIVDNSLFVYKGDYPNNDHDLNDMELVYEGNLDIAPDEFEVDGAGEFLIARQGAKLAVFDAELAKLHQYSLEGEQMFFLDLYLIGTIKDNKLIVCDFDSENRRELTKASGQAIITKNNKWLYYLLVDDGGKAYINREKILD